jgi:hypothetical protein
MRPDATTLLGQLQIVKEAILHHVALDPAKAATLGMPEHCRVEFAKWPKMDPTFRAAFWALPENDRLVQRAVSMWRN